MPRLTEGKSTFTVPGLGQVTFSAGENIPDRLVEHMPEADRKRLYERPTEEEAVPEPEPTKPPKKRGSKKK